MAQLVAEYAISDEPLGNQAIYIDGVDRFNFYMVHLLLEALIRLKEWFWGF